MSLKTRLGSIRSRMGRKKPRSLNKKARDEIVLDRYGRPLNYPMMLVVDECGNLGELPKAHENTFGFAVAVVDRPDAFGILSEYNRQVCGGEVKASRDPRKDEVIRDIATLHPTIYGFYLDKGEPPHGWRNSTASDKMIGTLDLALGSVLRDMEGNTYVVVDYHTAYDKRLVPVIQAYSDGSRKVDGDKYGSKDSEFKGVLQTVDYPANALRGYAEIGDGTRADKLDMRIRRIGKDDSIRRRI